LVISLFLASPAVAADGADAASGASSDQPAAATPLERLRTRSSAARWKVLSEQLRSTSRVGGDDLELAPTRPQAAPHAEPAALPAAETEEPAPAVEQPAPAFRPAAVHRVAQNPAGPEPGAEERYAEPTRNPRDLRKVTEILPFADYEPDPEVAKDDPCLYRCPRPDGAPCKAYPPGETPVCPEEIKLSDEAYVGRALPETSYTWEASNLFHNPLYFEDAALERYGHTHHCLVQPFASVGKGLPYQATIDPICKEMYTLGWYRPGECAPKKCYQIPWNWDAAAVEAGAVTGMFFIFP